MGSRQKRRIAATRSRFFAKMRPPRVFWGHFGSRKRYASSYARDLNNDFWSSDQATFSIRGVTSSSHPPSDWKMCPKYSADSTFCSFTCSISTSGKRASNSCRFAFCTNLSALPPLKVCDVSILRWTGHFNLCPAQDASVLYMRLHQVHRYTSA